MGRVGALVAGVPACRLSKATARCGQPPPCSPAQAHSPQPAPPQHAKPAELKLTSYSFESCCAAVLQLRLPRVPPAQLHAWFAGGAGAGRWRCLAYWVQRARLCLALLDQLDVVGRTGEMARTFGIDFHSGG